jgi:tetratricopeptide (TPR) repeat protein
MQTLSIKQLVVCAFIIVLSFFLQPQAFAYKAQNSSDKELVNKLLQLTYNCQFEDAKALVNQVLKEDSLSLEWNYFDGMIIYRSMFEKGEYNKEGTQFTSIMERVVKMGEDRIARNPQDTIALFYTGGAYGYLARYILKDGSFFKAASVGKKGMDLHEKLIAISPNCYDAYFSLGLYHSVASNVPWFIKPILYIFGISGDEEKGIEYLTLVSSKGNLAVYEARWVLAQLYSRRKEDEKAFNIYQSLAQQFPNNYSFVSQVVEMLCDQKRYHEAIEIGKKVCETNKLSNTYNVHLVHIYEYLAQGYTETEKYQEAIEAYKKIIEMRTRVTYSYAMIGNIYEKEKDNENAIDSYKKAIETGGEAKYREMAEERLEVLTKNGNQ